MSNSEKKVRYFCFHCGTTLQGKEGLTIECSDCKLPFRQFPKTNAEIAELITELGSEIKQLRTLNSHLSTALNKENKELF